MRLSLGKHVDPVAADVDEFAGRREFAMDARICTK